MAGPANTRKDAAKRNAQKLFSESQRRNDAAREEREKARNAIVSKTAKLRALRLAKEEADKANAEGQSEEKASS